MDLPLIAALCNDKSLLKQTNTIDLGKDQTKAWCNGSNNECGAGSNNKNDEIREPKAPVVADVSETRSQNATSSCTKSATSTKTNANPTSTKNVCTNGGTDKSLRAITKTNVQKLAKSFDASRLNPLSCGSQIRSMMETSAKANLVVQNAEAVVSSTTKTKSINAKLSKTGNCANKLKYSVSQPLQKNVVAGTTAASVNDAASGKSSATNNRTKYKAKNKSMDVTLTRSSTKDTK